VLSLNKYISDPDHIIEYELIAIRSDVSFPEELIQILERQDRRLRTKTIPYVKVLWKRQSRRGDMRARA